MAWHDIGHGADEVSYWQWRSALNGQEEIHGTLVAPDGEPVPLLEEVTQTAKEFGEVQSAFRGTRVVSQVALLADYDSRRAIGWQKHTEKYDQFAILKGYYHALRKLAQSIDIVSVQAGSGAGPVFDTEGTRRAPVGIREQWRAPGAGATVRIEGRVQGTDTFARAGVSGGGAGRARGTILCAGKRLCAGERSACERNVGRGRDFCLGGADQDDSDGGGSIAAVRQEQWMAGWATVRDHATSRAGADYLRWRRAGCEADDSSSGMDGEDINFKSESQDM
jgi:hypothetical protein